MAPWPNNLRCTCRRRAVSPGHEATIPAASKTGKEPAILSGISDAAAEDFVKSDLPSSGMAQRYCPHGWFDGLKTIEKMMPFGTPVVQRRPIMDHGNVWECMGMYGNVS